MNFPIIIDSFAILLGFGVTGCVIAIEIVDANLP